MMQQRPVIAILTANVLVGVGLRSILEKAAPAADVELFGNFQEFAEADPERFIHYFVTAQLFAAHNAFFRARSHRTIVLANGQTPAGVHCIDVPTRSVSCARSCDCNTASADRNTLCPSSRRLRSRSRSARPKC